MARSERNTTVSCTQPHIATLARVEKPQPRQAETEQTEVELKQIMTTTPNASFYRSCSSHLLFGVAATAIAFAAYVIAASTDEETHTNIEDFLGLSR